MELKKLVDVIVEAYNEQREDGSKVDEVSEICGYEMEEYLTDYKNENYSFDQIEHFGGEGEGDEMWKVFEVKDLKTEEVTNFRVSGYYDSWNGTEWDRTVELVEAYEVTVTRWKGIK